MKKLAYLLVLVLLPVTMMADSFSSMWKNVAEAQSKDLPKTQMEWLSKIIAKAEKEKQYGHLLKARLQRASAQTQIAPDSADAEIERLEQKTLQTQDNVLRAIYASVLGNLYQMRDDEASEAKSRQWFARSMEQPALLAQHKSTDYEPAMARGIDSKIFYDDLLHVIGFEAEDYTTLHDYYSRNGNRAGACIAAYYQLQKDRELDVLEIRKSKYLQRIDSLISVYSDLREAGELAIEHYNFISQATDATVEDRINYINYALSRWGAWPRMNILRNAQSDLQQPSFNINIGDYMLLPNAERLLRVNSIRNITELNVDVYRLNMDGNTTLDPNDKYDYKEIQKYLQPQAVQHIGRRYIGLPAWKETSDSIVLDKLPVGMYLVEASTSNSDMAVQRALLHVSNLYVMHEGLPDKKIRFVVVNATTGQPVPGATIVLTAQHGQDDGISEKATLTSDKKGEAIYSYKERKPNKIYVYTAEDRACGNFDMDGHYSYWESRREADKVSLFTDRAIYRPGQQVHVTAVAYHIDKNVLMSNTINGHKITFALRDANNKQVATKTTETDSFGTASADFTLPQNGLTGNFAIIVNGNQLYGATSFRVEQYKRPTFQVEFEPYKQAYHAGDTVQMRGVVKSYAGVPVQGAKVNYTVERRQSVWWRWNHDDNATTVWADSAVTADDGSFMVRMPMILPEASDRPVYYNTVVNAKVTDMAGETHEATASLPLSNRSSVLTCDLPSQSLRDSLKSFTFTRRNIAGENIAGTVHYRFGDGPWKTAEANKPVLIDHKPASGRHLLVGICEGDTVEQNVVVFTLNDKKTPIETHDWFYVSDQQFRNDGKPVYIQLGSSDKDVHVYYTVFGEKQVLAQGSKVLNDEIHTEKLQYKEAYGDGILINLAWVKRGKLYTHRIKLLRPEPDRAMKLSWKTFRNQLVPGQKEEWTLQILGPDGKPAKAQLLATMYDKSLDNIAPHRWNFNPRYGISILFSSNWAGGSNSAIGLYGFQDYKSLPEHVLDFSRFDEEMFSFAYPQTFFTRAFSGRLSEVRIRGAKPMAMAKVENTAIGALDINSNSNNSEVLAVTHRAADELKAHRQHEEDSHEASVPLRENLNETAFFYPALTTDAQGNVAIKFTLPESVTTWHFMGIAHDEQVNYGHIEAEAVAKKTVMVQPNLPRFIRMGDRAQVGSRIVNTSEKSVNGTARLQLINPETEAVVCEWSKRFELASNQSSAVTFDVDASQLATLSKGTSLFIARIMAEGRGFSDGEQHYLPLLPDREYITTTIPFTQHGPGTKSIDLTQLFPTADAQNKLTVEYTNTPAWLVVQALPSIAAPNEKNAISLAAAIYANTIGYGIVTQAPKIAQTLKLWQQETQTQSSLTSNLQKNEELKTMVLSETPWLAAAEKETDQKQQLVNFLDESTISYRIQQFTDKLEELQNSNGSFSWWPGMAGSDYITVGVTTILARLQHIMGNINATSGMLDKAFAYLDHSIAKEVAELKKQEKQGIKHLAPSEMACNYLYANAITRRAANKDAAYLIGLLEKMPTALTIYGKANSAVILAYNDRKQRAKEYLQSLNEYTVYQEEMGRYYDTRRAHYSWSDYKMPTQVAAIEAIQLLNPADTQTIDEMQRWLLQQKRTTGWSNPLNAVNAVYAFLTNEHAKIDMEKLAAAGPATLCLDGQAIPLPQATAGMGYAKTTLQDPRATTFTANQTGNGSSWGALYAQFWQKNTDVKSASAGLSVKREIVAADGNTAPTNLQVGDKVRVRITITADRDYDFVQVQDKRAACLEPASQLSGYHWGYYCAPQDNATNYYFDRLPKGTHTVETTYYVDREGDYTTGICTAQCAYSPEYSARHAAITLRVTK